MTTTDMAPAETAETVEQPDKPRRPHRRTQPEPPAVAGGQALVVEPEPQLPKPPAYLVTIAQSRRERERRLLVLEVERCDREITSRTMQLRLNCAPVTEVRRVEEQLLQARDERVSKIEAAGALTERELVLAYCPENRGWAG